MTPQPSVSKRVKNISISKPIVYGNTATPFGPTRPADAPVDHTHHWTIYVKDPAIEGDLTPFIKKVVFKLHDTYTPPSRVVDKPPFEITETGWGEFEIGIKIYFNNAESGNAAEKTLQLYHHLKLHPYGSEMLQNKNGTDVIESSVYDEIIFNEPTETMFEMLTEKPGSFLHSHNKNSDVKFTKQLEAQELDRLSSGLEVVLEQISKQKQLLEELEKDRVELLESS
ncbi:hypothetical protein BABINDRAFT_162057 [Babjeviella inositovora NRRL Y-12698]|uniref:Protein AF-9 homolog n=1 Tax=Babjeviella inositovora NRRL Y-12698 TaxID=984486 RepID=A0A1E3QPI0_9ASCO|nr:uncharacterized protein BABINDRAFT_162057 [Babjeviella inositovora NRRL Y-12698]ODQ78972.1 hypothetical protein BABINDRAFT_162057 [Babjeviella inositovora NRRL Y-12698]